MQFKLILNVTLCSLVASLFFETNPITGYRQDPVGHRISPKQYHNALSMIARIADSMAVRRHGEVLAFGITGAVMTLPIHPYKELLSKSVPDMRTDGSTFYINKPNHLANLTVAAEFPKPIN